MHFMPDTEDEDSAAETFWPEGYKQVLRDNVSPAVREKFFTEKPFQEVYEKGYKNRSPSHSAFLETIADMVAIGAENGADNAFDEIIDSFLKEAPLPYPRAYAVYATPAALSEDLKQALRQIVIDEYSKDNIYVYAYGVGYTKTYPTFEDYIQYIADLVVTGTMNGADDILENIYRAFYKMAPLLPVRRHARRLKVW